MSSRLEDANRRYQLATARLFTSKLGYALLGAVGGLALSVRALVSFSATLKGGQGALLILAGILFGMIVGIDLHSSRGWQRFGRYSVVVRFVLACSAGGTAIGVAGILLGIVARNALWQYGLGGAGLGVLLLLWGILEGIDPRLSNEEL